MTEKKKIKLADVYNKLFEYDKRFDEMLQTMGQLFSSFKNDVMNGLDKVMGELEKAREDRIFAKAEDDRQNERLDGLDNRLKKVEAKVG